MIYRFLLILGCQACTKSLIMYVANIDSSYVGFLIILRSYVCRILDLYEVLTYVCRIYLFLISTISCQYWIPTYVGYDNLFQTGILCSKKAVHLLQRRCRRIPQALLVSTIPLYNLYVLPLEQELIPEYRVNIFRPSVCLCVCVCVCVHPPTD